MQQHLSNITSPSQQNHTIVTQIQTLIEIISGLQSQVNNQGGEGCNQYQNGGGQGDGQGGRGGGRGGREWMCPVPHKYCWFHGWCSHSGNKCEKSRRTYGRSYSSQHSRCQYHKLCLVKLMTVWYRIKL